MDKLVVYSDEELKRIQKLELDALKVIIDICNKLKIDYFLIGGSALGAVRHQGFIPWDDDIDIAIHREDYERFLKEAPNFLPDKYHLQTPYNTPQSPYMYSKLRIDGTEFVEYCNRNLNIHHGVYVDIFPYDDLADDEVENLKQFNKSRFWLMLYAYRQIPDLSSKPIGFKGYAKACVRRIVYYALHIIPRVYIVNRANAYMTKYNNKGQKCSGCLFFPVRNTEYALKSDIYPLAELDFEDIIVKVPHNCDAYLTNHYNDYMRLPPAEMRFGHKPYKINLNK